MKESMQHDHENPEKGANVVRLSPGPKCRLEVDWENTLRLIRVCAGFRCTHPEVAVALDVSLSTLTRFFAKWPEAREAYDAGMLTASASLRRRQFEVAMSGNVAMLVWLGKNVLGQRDRIEVAEATISHEEALQQLE